MQHNLKAKATGSTSNGSTNPPYEFRSILKFYVVSFSKTHAVVFTPFRAIESILLSVLSALEAEMVFIRALVGGLLAELEDDIDHDRFKRLLHYSRRLAAFKSRATLVSTECKIYVGAPSKNTKSFIFGRSARR